MPRNAQGPYLRKNARGIFEIRWSEDGRSRRRSTGCTHMADAQQVLGRFLLMSGQAQEAQGGESGAPVSVLLNYYRQHHVLQKVASQGTAELAIEHLLAHFKDKCITTLGPSEFEGYVRARAAGRVGWLQDEVRRGFKKAGESSTRRELGVLTAAVNFAVRKRLISKTDAPVVELPPESEPRDRWLTHAESDALFKSAAAESQARVRKGSRAPVEPRMSRVERFIWLTYFTAGRKSAILELNWNQVDFDAGVIHLNPQGRKQTKKRRASVAIADALLPALRRMHNEKVSEYVLDHPGHVRRVFDRVVKAAKLKDVTPNVLRHTAATQMARDGVDLWVIAQILGNSLAMVEKTYAHHDPRHSRKGLQSLSRKRLA